MNLPSMLTGCPIIVAESTSYIITLLLECKNNLDCPNRPEPDLIERILLGELNPLETPEQLRPLIYSTLYGGLLLLHKSTRYGVIPLSRLQLPGKFSAVKADSSPSILSDREILDFWSRLVVEPENEREILTLYPPLKIVFSEQGDCNVAPTGFLFLKENGLG
jgi:hypothetical protein